MTDKKNTGLDRRSVVAAAAAGAAMPLISVGAKAEERGEGTRIIVDLGGFKLSEEAGSELQAKIHRAVLEAVAESAPRAKVVEEMLPRHTLGLVFRPNWWRI